jgi:hypothetical protein
MKGMIGSLGTLMPWGPIVMAVPKRAARARAHDTHETQLVNNNFLWRGSQAGLAPHPTLRDAHPCKATHM